MNGFENKKICKKCGGKCCKMLPCMCLPEDFNLKTGNEKLVSALKSGEYCIDWWGGNPSSDKKYKHIEIGYFVRPATKTKEGVLYDPSWGGECIFLTRKGCRLSFKDRPTQGKMLEPKRKGCDIHGLSKQAVAIEWLPYNELLSNMREKII